MTKKTNGKERAVLITTQHRGVFFGYAEATDGATIKLRAGRNCIYWPTENKGFLGLAAIGPLKGARVGPAKVGDVHKVKGPLEICTNRALHATLIPPKWEGERMWVVALIGETVGDDEKYAALEREIIGEAL